MEAGEHARQALIMECYARWSWLGFPGISAAEVGPGVIVDVETLVLALLVRLRLGLGTGTRADLLTWLLGSDTRRTVAETRTVLGYSEVALRAAAQEMALSGLLDAAPGAPLRVGAAPGWRTLLGPATAAGWDRAAARMALLADLVLTVEQGHASGWSAYVWRSRGRDVAERHGVALCDEPERVWDKLARTVRLEA